MPRTELKLFGSSVYGTVAAADAVAYLTEEVVHTVRTYVAPAGASADGRYATYVRLARPGATSPYIFPAN